MRRAGNLCLHECMRWTRLFNDLEAQLVQLEQAERAADVSDRTRSERGQVSLVEALAADCGATVTLDVLTVGLVTGTVQEVGKDWCVMDCAAGTHDPGRSRPLLLPMSAVQTVVGLTGFVDQREGASRRRFDMRSALRALGRDRARVRIYLSGGGTVQGTIDRVGLDHCDLADHADDAPRRQSEIRAVHAVPLWAVCALRQV